MLDSLNTPKALLVTLVLVASVNLCLYFFCYAPAASLAANDEVTPTTTSVELTLLTTIDWPADSP